MRTNTSLALRDLESWIEQRASYDSAMGRLKSKVLELVRDDMDHFIHFDYEDNWRIKRIGIEVRYDLEHSLEFCVHFDSEVLNVQIVEYFHDAHGPGMEMLCDELEHVSSENCLEVVENALNTFIGMKG